MKNILIAEALFWTIPVILSCNIGKIILKLGVATKTERSFWYRYKTVNTAARACERTVANAAPAIPQSKNAMNK